MRKNKKNYKEFVKNTLKHTQEATDLKIGGSSVPITKIVRTEANKSKNKPEGKEKPGVVKDSKVDKKNILGKAQNLQKKNTKIENPKLVDNKRKQGNKDKALGYKEKTQADLSVSHKKTLESKIVENSEINVEKINFVEKNKESGKFMSENGIVGVGKTDYNNLSEDVRIEDHVNNILNTKNIEKIEKIEKIDNIENINNTDNTDNIEDTEKIDIINNLDNIDKISDEINLLHQKESLDKTLNDQTSEFKQIKNSKIVEKNENSLKSPEITSLNTHILHQENINSSKNTEKTLKN